VLVAAVLLAGIVVGVVWRFVTPLPQLRIVDHHVTQTRVEAETAVAADAWFLVCAFVAGALTALVVFARVREARLDVLLGVTVASLLASVIAWRVGLAFSPPAVGDVAPDLAEGARFEGPLRLSAKGVLFGWPLAAVAVYFALGAGLDRHTPPGEDRRY
jgi:hypothetical protein